jgi:hypothetical protein
MRLGVHCHRMGNDFPNDVLCKISADSGDSQMPGRLFQFVIFF